MPRQVTSKKKLKRLELQKQACALRCSGLTYDRIAVEMGYSKAWVAKLVQQAMEEMHGDILELANQERERQLLQTGMLLEVHFPKAQNGNMKSADMVLRLLARRAKVVGADMPDKIAPTSPDGDKAYDPITDAERVARLAAIFERARERRNLEAGISPEEGGTGT